LELPGYDARGAFGMSLAYATSDRGGCHMRAWTVGDEIITGVLPPDSLAGKAAHVIDNQDCQAMKFTGIWCDFWAAGFDQMALLVSRLWKREVAEEELRTVGERVWNLGRLFNLREGVEADTVPPKFYAEEYAHTEGPAAGKAIGAGALHDAIEEYYTLRGWDAQGVPTEAKLAELGIDVRL